MISDNEQIKALISEIDATLEKPSNLLGRLSGEAAKHRATLKHLRNYLGNLQNSLDREEEVGEVPLFGESTLAGFGAAGGEISDSEIQGHEIHQVGVIEGETVYEELPLEVGNATAGENIGTAGLTSEASIALIQRLGHELEQLKAGLMAPLQVEVNQLQHQRQILAQEVRQLQQQHSGAQSEQAFQQSLQALMMRLQEHLVAQVTAQVAAALQGIQADSANFVADQMEAQPTVPWQERSMTAGRIAIGGESPMERASVARTDRGSVEMGRAGSSARQLPNYGTSHGDRSNLGRNMSDDSSLAALDGPELTLDSLDGDSFAAVPDESTSSAGIARRRILAAQNSEFQAQQSLELESRRQAGRSAQSLEDFYISVGASTAAQAAQQRAMAVQHRAQHSQPGGIKGHYQNLEDALFDGIPAGDNPWAQAANQTVESISQPSASHSPIDNSPVGQPRLPLLPGQPQLAETAYPPATHQIRRLTDLVDQRFDDFGAAADSAQTMPESLAAFYGDLPVSLHRASEKKKPFRLLQPRRSQPRDSRLRKSA